MLLRDIGKNPDSVLKRINRHLESNYGFVITETVDKHQLADVIETIEQEIHNLKLSGESAKTSSEISKRLLILEGLRSLSESFKSPDFDNLIECLADCVVEFLRKTSTSDDPENFENAICDAMTEYRSSEYLFPDIDVENALRSRAMDRLGVPDVTDTVDAYSDNAADYTDIDSVESITVMEDTDENVKDKTMKEQNLFVKKLRVILESEVSQAEVMMAAKGFAQELQEMVEKVGRLQNEDLPPVTDQMRETYGTDSASAFQTLVYSALQNVMDSLYTAKAELDDAVESMAKTGSVGAQVDMDKDVAVDVDDASSDVGTVDDLDNISADEIQADEFGGAEEEEPLGRSLKAESAEHLKARISEMKKLINRAKKLKEIKG